MKLSSFVSALSLAASATAQSFSTYTDKNDIEFYRASVAAGENVAQWGMALPAAGQTDYEQEYIGNIVAPNIGESWMGVTHMSGMTNTLILITWLEGETIHTSFRFATGYTAPPVYTGNATLIPISQTINDTHYELTYRCQNCWTWDMDGATGDQIPATTASAAQIVGWAQATTGPTDPSDDGSAIKQHDNSGIMGVNVASARNSAYTNWIKMATATGSASPTAPPYSGGGGNGTSGSPTASGGVATSAAPSATGAACPASNPAANTTWDYIIVGAGAGGIPLADKLSEDGSSVLLVERGPPSSGRWGGTMKPEWLEGTNLTRFDVPGLDNEIWADSEGIACTDYSVMAGCVLGGGTAVNAGLWWRANPSDFDYNFPEGWKASDVEPAIARTFERIPFTDRPSMDGVLYKPQGYEVVAGALAASGWDNVTADESPAAKNFTFSHPNHMFNGGERGGPMATYLVTASERKNFKLVHSTDVSRVIRSGSKITGVEMQAFLKGGQCGVAKVKPQGKVILAAGAFGTPKILFRSGIGPQDQLETVQEAEGDKMVKRRDWINLPVGHNLDDHTNTDVVITHPDVEFYDFYAAYDDPIKADMNKYLDSRSGILAQSAPNLAAVFWQEIEGDDGVVRQLQWTARVEGSHDISSKKAMTISQYLGRGKTSRGRTTINGALNMVVSELPYLNNDNDIAAVAAGIDSLKEMLASDPSIKIVYPPQNQTTAKFLADYTVTTGSRSANHWMGSCKMGLDSGLTGDGTSVVDTDTKVYGTDNLFVVDASIFPGMVTTNPSGLIVAAAEHAAPLIAKVKVGAGNATSTVSAGTGMVSGTAPAASGSGVLPGGPYGNGTGTYSVLPTGTGVSVEPVATESAGGFPSHLSSILSSTAPAAGTGASSSIAAPVESSKAPYPISSSPASPSSPAAGTGASTSSSCTQTITVSRSSGVASPSGTSGFPAPSANGTVPVMPTGTGGTAYPTATLPPYGGGSGSGGPGGVALGKWARCGGMGFEAGGSCEEGLVCKDWNEYYSQCVDGTEM